MIQSTCVIHTCNLASVERKSLEESSISKTSNTLNITYCSHDTLDQFEKDLNNTIGKSSLLYYIKKKFASSLISVISVVILMFAFISSSVYEDVFKKLMFDTPFAWEFSDSISLVFVLVFFLGLLMIPSFLDAEGSAFRSFLSSWFNKDINKSKRLGIAFSEFDSSTQINLYNFDLVNEDHWLYRILVKTLLSRFKTINFYVRSDQVEYLTKKLNKYNISDIEVIKHNNGFEDKNLDILLSPLEHQLLLYMQLSSTYSIDEKKKETLLSLELFEYCTKNFFETELDEKERHSSDYQHFINRSFYDFNFLEQKKSIQISFTSNVKYKELKDEKKKLAIYLRNHIEDCIETFRNPMSLMILYYYVKEIVFDENRKILILEAFILLAYEKQQYELIDQFWFDLAGDMFDSKELASFESSTDSIYRKLSIDSLNKLIFLLERNGYFNQALLINEYLYEINPTKYAIGICSLYERMGDFTKAYESLPSSINISKNEEVNELEIKYFQRKAWIIVSQRKVELKQEALDCLESLKILLFSHNEDANPLSLWHYYNIQANLDEWNEDYNSAIDNYNKCLKIPALGSFEYGATFVNMAISYRLKYLLSDRTDAEFIEKSISLGNIGIYLKQSVGDRDEMPVVLHNQALNILYKLIDKDVDKEKCLDIISLTHEGIDILIQTKSVKRLGMLYMENLIAKNLYETDILSTLDDLKKHMSLMDTNELRNVVNLYKDFLEAGKITKISFLDEI
ncbi:MAG: hypothetical protein HRT43_01740 [Campylobacteraceae bacterium]|nr:hypothetical protein [Campylobacteraceae bacterium]